MSIKASEIPKTISADEAAGLVNSGDWVEYCGALATPDLFDAALAKRIPKLHDLKIRACFSLKPRAALEVDPEAKHVTWYSWHFSPYERKKGDAGRIIHIPMNLGETADYYRRFIDPPEIAVVRACPMDEQGNFNLSVSNVWIPAILERAKIVVVETAPNFPVVSGPDNVIHCSDVDYVIEGDTDTPVAIPGGSISEVDRAVGNFIAEEIPDGSCLQIGIGGMPNAVCAALIESGIKDLGVHTEMLTDGIVELYQAGQVTGIHKQLDPEKIVFSFGVGSDNMYNTLHNNDDFLCRPSDYTNMPHVIMQNDNMMSINNTTQMDLQGQAASESDGYRQISGSGGQLQFVRGAYASKGGKSFMCLASTYEKNGERRSRIVADLTRGNIVTTPRTDIMYVVTEYGIINLKAKSLLDRARGLISLAHPDFREDLERDARDHGLIPKQFW